MLCLNLESAVRSRKYDVDVAFWGHVHQYERTCGIVTNGVCGAVDEDGTVHGMPSARLNSSFRHSSLTVVVGSAGNTYQLTWLTQAANYFIPPDWYCSLSSPFVYYSHVR